MYQYNYHHADADDTALVVKSIPAQAVVCQLEEYFCMWNIQADPQKSQVAFPAKRRHSAPKQLRVFDRTIPWQLVVKYLG
ncbi:unnamed protein product [Acanthoscelides obtectus]|uniref:Uncharacterized protein n=1 Tax=Acanthoscelides obtectus TaxID=200917 RepID=A0A9P0KKB2_ACAOB|nr:unnamed protein product [Acanthoscelides obtectus]CAK1647681.1 hypothetical protein AOBTE_LOCUS15334 [Acanthoscelides obtectus]